MLAECWQRVCVCDRAVENRVLAGIDAVLAVMRGMSITGANDFRSEQSLQVFWLTDAHRTGPCSLTCLIEQRIWFG